MQRLRVNHLCRPRALALLIKTASIHLNLLMLRNMNMILRTVPIKNDTPDVLIQSCVHGKNRNTRHHVLVVVVFHYTGARTTHGDSLVVTDRRPACAC